MNAEERHRLHENELQRLAEQARERSRPVLEQYGTAILFAIAGLLVVIAAIIWWSKSGGSREAGWDELSAAFRKPVSNRTAEDFGNVAVNHPGTTAAAWAKLYEGEAHLASGIESLFTDKDGAVRDLTDARAAFEEALESEKAGPQLTVRALYGLARTLEATSDGELEPAIESYQKIVDDYPETVYETLAQDRLEALKSSDAKAFYAWFSKQKPTPKDPISPPSDSGLLPGMSPFDGPDFGTPSSGTLPAVTPPTGLPTDPASDDPAAADTPAEAPRPVSTTPADPTAVEPVPETPAEPAAETPVEPSGETPSASEAATETAPESAPETEAESTDAPADSPADEKASPALPPQN